MLSFFTFSFFLSSIEYNFLYSPFISIDLKAIKYISIFLVVTLTFKTTHYHLFFESLKFILCLPPK